MTPRGLVCLFRCPQCRYGYKDLTEVQTVVQQYKANNIPLDTMWYDYVCRCL